MLLGQEFWGYAAQVEKCAGRIRAALEGIYELRAGRYGGWNGIECGSWFRGRA